MKLSIVPLILVSFALATIWGCSPKSSLWKPLQSKPYFVAKAEPWRRREERQCLASGAVRRTAFLTSRSSLGGHGFCGALRPFSMSAAVGGTVRLKPAALLVCPMVPAVDRWLSEMVVPAARRSFGQPVVEIRVAASYSCRPINSKRGNKLSEHGHANAIDVSAFILADGRKITVKNGWWGGRRDSRFLHRIHDDACRIFYTVLGPNYNKLHHDHFHLDLARHGRTGAYHVCR